MPNLPEELRQVLFLERADLRLRKRDTKGARDDTLSALEVSDSDRSKVNRTVRLLREADDSALATIADTPAIRSLSIDDKLIVFTELDWTDSGVVSAVRMLENALQDSSISVEQQQRAQHQLSLGYIALGRFRDATEIIEECTRADSNIDIANRFNYAMVSWGLTQSVDPVLFKKVLDADSSGDGAEAGANYNQCMAITFWALNEGKKASHDWAWLASESRKLRLPRLVAGDI